MAQVWKRRSEQHNNFVDEEANNTLPTTSSSVAKSSENPNECHGSRSGNVVVLTNDDVLGDAIPRQEQEFLRSKCYFLLRLNGEPNRFPGSHPVSLDKKNLEYLGQTDRDYRVTWKADGTRYLMLLNSDGCYLIDRNFNFRKVQLRFPLAQGNGVHDLTLLDGEMVIDTHPETNKQVRRYLVFDVMSIDGESVIQRSFGERWEMLEQQVIGPRDLESNYRYELEPFGVEIKKFWLLSEITDLLEKFTPTLLHGADGLIFQAWTDKYVPFTHTELLKWKSHDMNSVDFLVKHTGSNPSLYLNEKGRMKCMFGHKVVFRNGEDPSQLSEKIIDYMRVREDKSTPNAFSTYEKVKRSIDDNITEEVLLDHIREIVEEKRSAKAEKELASGMEKLAM
ncbi:hypothetical protein MKW94_027506 [Papaver nudicaule]|uniref:mRNA guanylyltransferase n=1 Tax=Papaver nudicaule TaxID=74823 RepID=A0AA41SA99_PAPNU|nr:hypothetical protein [Papaver nudicaule]